MVCAGKSLALQLGNKPLQPILNGNGVAAKGNAVGPVEGPVFTAPRGEGGGGGTAPRLMELTADWVVVRITG